jgi:hypothetical protein
MLYTAETSPKKYSMNACRDHLGLLAQDKSHTLVVRHTSNKLLYFPNAFFAILHTEVAFMKTYSTH